ncbi:MAG: hypothetical protein DMD91_33325 [Candidatus Rokuibacteriota bacterium]|nr:MAG: hypothetical protein DMD91_33325 [Candidatus Rokubacteria bacterium]
MGRASATLASCAGAHANYDAAIAYARFALDVADEVDDAELRIAASHLLGVCLEARGEYGSAVRFLEAVVDGNHADVAHRRLGLVLPPYIFDNGFLGIAHGFTGRFAAAKGHSLRAVRTADEYDHPGAQTFAYTLYASLLAMQGEFDEAGVWAERAVTLGERNGVFAFVSSARVVLGWVCAWTGRVAEGIEYLEQAIAFEEQVGLKMHAPTHYERLGEALMLGGDLQRAREIALKACTLAEELGEQGSRAEALRLLGDVARAAGDHAGASEHYDTAERMARELGMSPLIAHVYAGRAALAATAGHDAEWRRHSEQARMMYDEMGMRFWISTLDRAVTPSP